MSPYSSAATARVSSSTPDHVTSSQLDRVVRFESARWLPSLLSDLRSLEYAGENIPGIGDFRIARSTADNVRRLLTVISGSPLPEPRLAPFSGGGLALICSIGEKELTFSTYPSHEGFVFSVSNENDDRAEDGIITLEQNDQLARLISRFLA